MGDAQVDQVAGGRKGSRRKRVSGQSEVSGEENAMAEEFFSGAGED